MDYQTGFYPAGHYSYSNPGGQEGTLSSGFHIPTQNPEPYHYPINQGSLHVLEDAAFHTDDYTPAHNDYQAPTHNDINATQGHSHFINIYGLNTHHAGSISPPNDYFQGYGGIVTGANGPPLSLSFPIPKNPPPPSQHSLREEVPQLPYMCGNTQKELALKRPISFSTHGRSGVKLFDVLEGRFEGIDGRDDSPFEERCRGITIRIEFPGYRSSTHVEKKLKEYAEKDGRSKAKSMQLSTKDYKDPPGSVTRSKLAQEVSKRILWHIGDLMINSDLFPFNVNHQCDGKWQLGQGKMIFENMVITELKQVSSGSWSPVICVE